MPETGYTTAREHAIRASELLNQIDHWTERMENLTPDEEIQLRVTGGVRRFNTQIEFSRDLALAHAQTALALAATDEVDG